MNSTLQLPVLHDSIFWQHPLFEGLSQSQRLWLSSRMSLKTLPPKSIVFRPGETADQLYFVLSGKIKVEVISGQANWLIRELSLPNDFFGFNGMVSQVTRREYARSLRTETKLIVLNNKDLRRLMEVNFEFSEKMMKMCLNIIQRHEERAMTFSEKTARERLALLLKLLLDKAGRFDGKDWFYNSQLTQEEIGAYIGTGRQTVTEILTELKSKNILTYNWGKFWVHDLERV